MPNLEYPVLLSNMEVIFQKAHEGSKACKAFATLIQQSASLEESYGNSIVKVREREGKGREGNDNDNRIFAG